MNRRWFLAAFAAIVTLIAANTATAFPVANTCCSFLVVVSCNTRAACLPISVGTTWAGAAQVNSATACGGTWFPIAGACPPVPATLDAVTVDGTAVPFGGPTYITLLCGDCARVSVGYDPTTGCIRIQISVCP